MAIYDIETDKVDKFLSLFTNLRSLKFEELNVQLDFKSILPKMKALTSLDLDFKITLSTLESLN